MVIQDPEFLNNEIHSEFWSIIKKMGSENDLHLFDDLKENFRTYLKSFYEDGLIALKTGRPYKSVQRETLEKKMLKSGFTTEWRIKENESTMIKIANGEPHKIHGMEIVFDEELLLYSLNNINDASKRLDKLFSKPKI